MQSSLLTVGTVKADIIQVNVPVLRSFVFHSTALEMKLLTACIACHPPIFTVVVPDLCADGAFPFLLLLRDWTRGRI